MTLCGEKQELSKWFTGHSISMVSAGLDITGLPRFFKQPPCIRESDSYLYGWLQGYFAADGSSNGCISSVCRANLQFARDVATRIGLPTYGIREALQRGYTGTHKLYSLPFAIEYLPEDFFLRTKHKAGLTFHGSRRNMPRWKVMSVEPTSAVEAVFRVIASDGCAFTLEDNILICDSSAGQSIGQAE